MPKLQFQSLLPMSHDELVFTGAARPRAAHRLAAAVRDRSNAGFHRADSKSKSESERDRHFPARTGIEERRKAMDKAKAKTPLAGLPIAYMDNVSTKGHSAHLRFADLTRTTCRK
jgi:Asp-tRNA(Asn)/Glu-tRNA(Gln) amidotransferase A subunit family amidase